MIYPCANTRKCYWLCRDCLKGHKHCSSQCLDYLSRAKVKRLMRNELDKPIEPDIVDDPIIIPKGKEVRGKETHWDKLELERRLGK